MDDDEELSEEVIDHVFNEERVKSYYQSPEALIKAYKETGHFTVTVDNNSDGVGEDDKLTLKKLSTKDVWKYLITQLERLERNKQDKPDFDFDAEVRKLIEMHSEHYFIIEAYLKIGKAPIEAANYVKSKIEKELKAYNLQQSEKLRFSPNVLAEVEEEFRNEVQTQCYIAKSEFIKRLGQVLEANGITFKVHGDGKKGNEVMCQITEKTVQDYFDYNSYNGINPSSYKLLRFKSELGAN